jgi:hypothetical protein
MRIRLRVQPEVACSRIRLRIQPEVACSRIRLRVQPEVAFMRIRLRVQPEVALWHWVLLCTACCHLWVEGCCFVQLLVLYFKVTEIGYSDG